MTSETHYDMAGQAPVTEGVRDAAAPAMAGAPVDGIRDDYDGDPRPLGAGPDVGAEEWRPSRTPGQPTNVRAL